MGFGEDIKQTNSKDIAPQKNIEKSDDFFLKNPEFENLWQNEFKDFDKDIFSGIMANILKEGKKNSTINKDDILQFGKDIIKDIIQNNKSLFKINSWGDFYRNILKYKDIDTNKKDIDTNKKDIDTNKKDIDTNKENINKLMISLKGLYEGIDKKYKGSKVEIEDLKNQRPGIVAKLDNFDISPDEYFSYRLAAQKLAKSNEPIPNKYEFVKSFNQLNKFLDIDVQISFDNRDERRNEILKSKPDSLSDLKNNSERVLQNADIESFVLDDQKYIENFNSQEHPKKIIELYSGENEKLGKLLKYVNDDLSINNELLNKEIKDKKEREKIIKDITEKINQIFENSSGRIEEDTNKWFKEKIMTNCFQALASYFDNTTPNMENFADDFKLDVNQDISFDGKTIYMQGSINGNHVGLYYNMDSGELSMDDFMAYYNQDNGGTYVMGIKNGQKEKLKFKLPTIDELKRGTGDVDIGKHIENSDSISDYEKNIKSDLDSNISNNFSNVNLNKYYIEQFNEKNIAEQSALSDIFYNWEISNGVPILDFEKENKISRDLQPKQYELIKLVFNSLEDYKDPDKLRKFRNCVARLNLIIDTNEVKEGINNEDMFNKLFDSNNMKESMNNRKNNSGEINYFQLFDLMSKGVGDERVINLEVFDKILNIVEKKQEINDNPKLAGYSWFMDKYREKYYDIQI
ncbi:hypothetical protein K9M48_03475 [Candidatus Gracilibacteria bacterium]|nr:hypothetical protein [Candidatus Gracilibacteria bacterium]